MERTLLSGSRIRMRGALSAKGPTAPEPYQFRNGYAVTAFTALCAAIKWFGLRLVRIVAPAPGLFVAAYQACSYSSAGVVR